MSCHVYVEFTKVLLDDLRQTFPDVNLIGIRVCGTRDIRAEWSRCLVSSVVKKK